MNKRFSFPDALAFTDFPPEQRVFKFNEFAQIEQVENLVAAAKKRLQRTENAFYEHYDKNSRAAFDKGYQQGLNQVMAELTDVLTACQTSQTLMVELVMAALNKVLDEFAEEEVLAQLALTAVRNLVTEASKIIITVHPQFEQSVKHTLLQNLPASTLKQSIQVESNSEFANTDCQIETSLGVINASLQTQLNAIQNAFMESNTETARGAQH